MLRVEYWQCGRGIFVVFLTWMIGAIVSQSAHEVKFICKELASLATPIEEFHGSISQCHAVVNTSLPVSKSNGVD